MNTRVTIILARISIWFSLALSAPAHAQSLLDFQSTPTLKLFVYSFPGFSTSVLEGAEAETARILHPFAMELKWIDCTSRVPSASCKLLQVRTDFIIRFLPAALPQASATALGIAGSSADYATAFIFYDRILALRSHTRLLPAMLGRVVAHEIIHLLLPLEDHAGFGLMRGQWSADDLRITSAACLGLSNRSIQFLHREALRRVSAARPSEKLIAATACWGLLNTKRLSRGSHRRNLVRLATATRCVYLSRCPQ